VSVERQVLTTKTPREAILILARAIDELRAPNPWNEWDGDMVPLAEASEEKVAATDGEPDTSDVSDSDVRTWIGRNYGRIPSDDSEGRALIAQVRSDLERAGRGEVRTDDFVMDEGVVQSRIDWAPRDEEHRARRAGFARDILKLDVALGAHPDGGDWAADYASGGPMWLYIGNRDLLMQYPDNVKAYMIGDVELYDQRVAHEMGADLLKQPMIKDEHSPAGNLSMLAD
jgi:hypothetical protein